MAAEGKGTILSWNLTNWITVTLMAAVMFTLLGVIQKYLSAKVGGGSQTASS